MELILILLAIGIGFILFLIVGFFLMCYFVWSDPLREGGPLFFVKAKQNTIMHVMMGGNNGSFTGKRIFLSKDQNILPNGDLHYVGEEIEYNGEKLKVSQHTQWNIFGMVWLGWPGINTIHRRRQQWMEWQSTKEGREIFFRDELTPFLISKPFEYAMLLARVEDKGNVSMNFWFTVTIIPTNADKPIFGADDAYGQLQTACLGRALFFIRENTISTIGSENEVNDFKRDEFSALMVGLNESIPKRADGFGVEKALGYKILSATINDAEIIDKELRETSTLVYKAEQKAMAKSIEGEGVRDYEIKVAEGEKAHFDVRENYFKKIAFLPGAMEVEKLSKVPNLTTYVEGDGKGKTKIVLPSPNNSNYKQ